MAEIISTYLKDVCRTAYRRARYASCPFTSALLNDCLALGRDAAAGGARYAFTYPCFPGFINLIDSLYAIKCAVYEERVFTLAQMGDMLACNWEGYARERQYVLNRCDTFGNDQPGPDALAQELYAFILEELGKFRISVDSAFHPSYFAWIMHGELGKRAAATPDGRLQGTALSENLGAAQGRDRNGPGAIMRSISHIDQSTGIGGIATNFRFAKNLLAQPQGKAALTAFVHTFFAQDNFEMQLNVVDQKDLLAALERPEDYRTLMVRVAGYSDYFVDLVPVIQQEVIARTEHGGL